MCLRHHSKTKSQKSTLDEILEFDTKLTEATILRRWAFIVAEYADAREVEERHFKNEESELKLPDGVDKSDMLTHLILFKIIFCGNEQKTLIIDLDRRNFEIVGEVRDYAEEDEKEGGKVSAPYSVTSRS